MVDHTKDSDCAVDMETGCCRECGVGHDGPACPVCGGVAFHVGECEEISEPSGSRSVMEANPLRRLPLFSDVRMVEEMGR
jgi:hypothetical protein